MFGKRIMPALRIIVPCGLAGVLAFFSPGTLFISLLVTLIGCRINRSADPRDRKFVTVIFFIAVSLRISLSLVQDAAVIFLNPGFSMSENMDFEPNDNEPTDLIKEKMRVFMKVPDSDYSSAKGYVYTIVARGADNKLTRDQFTKGKEYGWHGYLYVIGFFYYLFGYSPISVKFINCILGALAAVVIYNMAAVNFNRPAARIAGLLFAFFPSLICWSTTNLKDSSVVLISAFFVYSLCMFLARRRIVYVLFMIGSTVMQFLLTKHEIWFVFLASFTITVAVDWFLFKAKRRIWLVLLCVIVYSFMPAGFKSRAAGSLADNAKTLLVRHAGYVWPKGVNYKVLEDKYYNAPNSIYGITPGYFIKSSGKLFLHFMFEPFPGRMFQLSFLPAIPQMLLWYFLIPFTAIGIIRGFALNKKAALAIFVYLSLLTFIIALSSGNVGTLYRHRDYVTPFYLIFAALGLARVFRRRRSPVNTQ